MCGIVSFFAYHYAAPAVKRDDLRKVRDAMLNRGPDGKGEWFSEDGRVGLGHRRLSIIDLSDGGSQPMISSKVVISFNGEIYNYRELRSDLESRGYAFRSNGDTEVLLALYRDKGADMFRFLRGMFAFALWDGAKQALLIARDPYGIKPLYYADDGWTVRAASQVKALLADGNVSRRQEPAGVVGFFLTGSVPEPFTLYQEIRSLPAGSYLWVDDKGPSAPVPYFSINKVLLEGEGESGVSFDAGEAVRQGLQESVRYHFVSDVPVGIFLSSGMDSAGLLGLAKEAGIKNIKALTLSFDPFAGGPLDELPLAEKMAKHFGAEHVVRRIGMEDVRAAVPRVFEAMDQPSIDGINTYLVSKAASESNLKVALSGVGADEMFGGYPSFKDVPGWSHPMKFLRSIPLAGKFSRRLLSRMPLEGVSPKAASLLEYGPRYEGAYFLRRGLFMPWELPSLLKRDLIEEGSRRLALFSLIAQTITPAPKSAFSKVLCLESSLYLRNQLLRDSDWASMAHSLEIRTPFVDGKLLSDLRRLLPLQDPKRHKGLLADALKNIVPAEVIDRKKTGFGVPIESLLEGGVHDEWRRNDLLRRQGCHWSRRWAYVVYESMK